MNYQQQSMEVKQAVETPIATPRESMVIVGVLGDGGSIDSGAAEGVTEHAQTMLSDVTSV